MKFTFEVVGADAVDVCDFANWPVIATTVTIASNPEIAVPRAIFLLIMSRLYNGHI